MYISYTFSAVFLFVKKKIKFCSESPIKINSYPILYELTHASTKYIHLILKAVMSQRAHQQSVKVSDLFAFLSHLLCKAVGNKCKLYKPHPKVKYCGCKSSSKSMFPAS